MTWAYEPMTRPSTSPIGGSASPKASVASNRAVPAAWPRNTGACTSPYRCTFLDICRGTQGDPSEQIPDGFKVAERLHGELATA